MQVTDFLNKPKKRAPKSRRMPLAEQALQDATPRASGEWGWDDADSKTFVGLYVYCFKMVYGFIPEELNKKPIYRRAKADALKMFHEMFDDDPYEMLAYMKWTWEREKKRNEWAEREGVDRSPMSTYQQFSAQFYTQYKVSASRKS